ncbi:MAG: hypothetical protein ACO1Q7_04025 [Gemmatimonas sp.]
MSFPASQMFRRDRRVTPTLMVVYQWAYEALDLVEIRKCKLSSLEHELDISREHLSRALTTLVSWGYLIEHNKVPNSPRWFTLAHSVREDLRVA